MSSQIISYNAHPINAIIMKPNKIELHLLKAGAFKRAQNFQTAALFGLRPFLDTALFNIMIRVFPECEHSMHAKTGDFFLRRLTSEPKRRSIRLCSGVGVGRSTRHLSETLRDRQLASFFEHRGENCVPVQHSLIRSGKVHSTRRQSYKTRCTHSNNTLYMIIQLSGVNMQVTWKCVVTPMRRD